MILVIYYSNAYSQIDIISVKSPINSDKELIVFDSTKNYLGRYNVSTYKGQLLFVLPIKNKEYGYDNFKDIVRKFAYLEITRYGNPAEKSEFNTKYEDLVGKYFYVDSVWKYDSDILNKYYFLLSEKNNPNNICYYEYNPDYNYSFHFIVVSHFNYLKQKYVGKNYIISKSSTLNIKTGKEIIIPDVSKKVWNTIDLSIIEDSYSNPVLIIKSGNDTSYIAVEHLESGLEKGNSRSVFEKSEWNKLVSTYGIKMMNNVLNGKINIGMPEKLLIMSWGKPDRINSSSYGDSQYVYDDEYVYIDNGKITSWQSSSSYSK